MKLLFISILILAGCSSNRIQAPPTPQAMICLHECMFAHALPKHDPHSVGAEFMPNQRVEFPVAAHCFCPN